MTIAETLTAISAYPIPYPFIQATCEGEGLESDAQSTADVRSTTAYKRAKAKTYLFLATAPNVSQGGISYSFTNEDKQMFRKQAQTLLDEVEDEEGYGGVDYGYQGDNF